MAEEAGTRVSELERQVADLMEEVDRYRRAAEDTLGQVDWCIGYFTGRKQHGIARALSANRAHIRTDLLHRAEEPLPVSDEPAE